MTAGVLYIVATPIGNLKDMTFRAVETLQNVDLVLCEDTRKSKVLLNHYLIKTKCISYHDHSTLKDRQKILSMLRQGKKLALISDGGTPLISDPGYKLVRCCAEEGIQVIPIPGASSVIAALSASGIATDNFIYIGFLPIKNKDRMAKYKLIRDSLVTSVIFEAPSKLFSTLEEIQGYFGDIYCTLAKEITKLHESIIYDKISKHIERLKDKKILGEYVIVIDAASKTEITDEELIEELKALLKTHSTKSAVDEVLKKHDVSKRRVYSLALQLS